VRQLEALSTLLSEKAIITEDYVSHRTRSGQRIRVIIRSISPKEIATVVSEDATARWRSQIELVTAL
jgi:hypothetical protein